MVPPPLGSISRALPLRSVGGSCVAPLLLLCLVDPTRAGRPFVCSSALRVALSPPQRRCMSSRGHLLSRKVGVLNPQATRQIRRARSSLIFPYPPSLPPLFPPSRHFRCFPLRRFQVHQCRRRRLGRGPNQQLPSKSPQPLIADGRAVPRVTATALARLPGFA